MPLQAAEATPSYVDMILAEYRGLVLVRTRGEARNRLGRHSRELT
jgi:hypothetical protein